MPAHFDVLIVGGGHAGAQAAIALRQRKFTGTIAIVTDEPYPPYERPPLSKDYFAGEKAFERILIRPEAFWVEREVALCLSEQVVSVDATAQSVTTATGAVFGYGTLIWATGGAPRSLPVPGADLAGVHAVRTRTDVDALKSAVDSAKAVTIIGAGYIGLEAAAVLTKFGKAVTVIEAQARVLARAAGTVLSHFLEQEHRAHGVELRLETGVSALEGDGCVQQVCLTDGSRISADVVIVGIGIIPSVEPLLKAGAAGSSAGGIRVDSHCRTNLPQVFAIGDCAAHPNAFASGAEIRLESVQNAHDMAAVAAREIIGDAATYEAVPWFWSNQYDLKLQTVGLLTGHDQFIVRGDPKDKSFSVTYLKNGAVIAVDCVNAVKDYVRGRGLILGTQVLTDEELASAVAVTA